MAVAGPAVGDVKAQRTRIASTKIFEANWQQEKRKLANDPLYAWLRDFEGNDSDAIVFAALSAVKDKEPPYDIYQLESNLRSVSGLLDRCLVYRRELQSLEEQAVRAALDHKLFNEQKDVLLELELAEAVQEQHDLQQGGQAAASGEFRKGGPGLGAGFATTAATHAKAAQAASKGESTRKELVHRKWAAAEQHQELLRTRYMTDGHALNFGDRANRIRDLLREDVEVAIQKTKCAAKGMERLLGVQRPMPDPLKRAYLDKLVMYVRALIEDYDLVTQEEVEFEHIVPLRQDRFKQNNTFTSAHIDQAEWDLKLDHGQNGRFTLNLSNEFAKAMKRLRVTGIAISYVPPDVGSLEVRTRSVSAVLFPPPVANPFSQGEISRPPVPFARVAFYDPSNIRFVSEPAFENLDPRGEWMIQISTNMYFPNATRTARDRQHINDVRIHFLLKGQLEKARADWTTVSL